MNKIKEKQLNKIKEQQQALTSTLHEIGYIEATKHGLLHKIAGINEDVEAFKNEKIIDEINPFGDIKDRFKNNNILKFY